MTKGAELAELAKELSRMAASLKRLEATGATNRSVLKPSTVPGIQGEAQADLLARGDWLLAMRRVRDRAFGSVAELCGDPAHDILLLMFTEEAKGRPVMVSGACTAGDMKPTTGLRWIRILSERQLIARRRDPEDARRCYLHLTPAGRSVMTSYLQGLDL